MPTIEIIDDNLKKFHEIVKNGDIKQVQTYLGRNTGLEDISAPDVDGNNAIDIAASIENKDDSKNMVSFLIKQGVKIKHRNVDQEFTKKDYNFLKKALRDFSVVYYDKDNKKHERRTWISSTVLHVALHYGVSDNIIRFLIKKLGADVNARDGLFDNAINIAVKGDTGNGNTAFNITKILIEEGGFDMNYANENDTPFIHYLAVMDEDKAKEKDYSGDYPRKLRESNKINDSLVELLYKDFIPESLSEEEKRDKIGNTAESLILINEFFINGLVPNKHGLLRVIKFLFEKGLDPNSHGGETNKPLFHIVVRNGNKDLIELFLQNGGDIGIEDENNNPAIICVAKVPLKCTLGIHTSIGDQETFYTIGNEVYYGDSFEDVINLFYRYNFCDYDALISHLEGLIDEHQNKIDELGSVDTRVRNDDSGTESDEVQSEVTGYDSDEYDDTIVLLLEKIDIVKEYKLLTTEPSNTPRDTRLADYYQQRAEQGPEL